MSKPKSPLRAIREHCRDCVGSINEIKNCMGNSCKLFEFRFGKNPYRRKKVCTEEEKAQLSENLRKYREDKANETDLLPDLQWC